MADSKDYNQGDSITTRLPGNRIAEAMRFREEQEARVAARNPLLVKEPDYLKQKLEYLRYVDKKYRKGASRAEKVSLNFLRGQVRLLKALLKPKWYHAVLFHPNTRAMRNYITGYYLAHRQQDRELKEIHEAVMQRRGYENITKTLAKEQLQPNVEVSLKRMIGMNLPAFSLPFTDPRHPGADFIMHCEKIPHTDVYFLKKMDVVSRPSDEALHQGNARNVKYTVGMEEKQQLSVAQAAQLVCGKIVCMSGNNWMRLDASRIGREDAFQLVKFDLDRALRDLPLAEQSRKQLSQLQAALRAGKPWEVHLELNGAQQKCVLSVHPEQRRLLVEDREGKELQLPKPGIQPDTQQTKVAQMVLAKGLRDAVNRAVDVGKGRSFSL